MKLEEIDGSSPAELQIKRQKAAAHAAKDQADALKARADIGADRLALQKAQKGTVERAPATGTIRPYGARK